MTFLQQTLVLLKKKKLLFLVQLNSVLMMSWQVYQVVSHCNESDLHSSSFLHQGYYYNGVPNMNEVIRLRLVHNNVDSRHFFIYCHIRLLSSRSVHNFTIQTVVALYFEDCE